VIGLAVGAVIDKHKMKKHFALDIADGRFTFHRRQEQIAAEAKLDGIYVIRTSLPANKIGSQAAVLPAQPSRAAIEKRTKRETVDGTPIMAWHDLIAHLGTLTINEVALPFGERRTIHMLARPAALQQQAFALLGVPLPRVQ
jgi:hypothetical protein